MLAFAVLLSSDDPFFDFAQLPISQVKVVIMGIFSKCKRGVTA